jgi:hypothetical protein
MMDDTFFAWFMAAWVFLIVFIVVAIIFIGTHAAHPATITFYVDNCVQKITEGNKIVYECTWIGR